MKKTYSLLLLLSIAMLPMLSHAQDAEKKTKTVHLKMVKEVNGERVVIDTVMELSGDADMQVIMKDMGMDDGDIPHEEHVWVEAGDGEAGEVRIIKIVQGEDGEEQVIEFKDGAVWTDEDGKMIQLDGKDGMFIHEDPNTNVQVIRLEDGTTKVTVTTDDAEGEKVFIMSDDELQESPDGEHKMIFINADDMSEEERAKLEEAIENGDQEGMMKQVNVEVRSLSDGENVVMIKTMIVTCELHELDELDEAKLRQAGVNMEFDNLKLNDLQFYPNPNDGRFTIAFEVPDDGDMSMQIRDLKGSVILDKSTPVFKGKFEEQIDISSQAAGVYFLTLTMNKKSTTRKIVLE